MTTPAEQAVIAAARRFTATTNLGDASELQEALRALDAEPAPKPAPRNYLVSYTCLTGPGLLTHGRTFGAGPADGGPATERTVRSWEYSILQASTEPGATRTYGVAIHSFTELGQ